jgi:sigma-B regulation protein RsbU (phosphoserine phosphatase)
MRLRSKLLIAGVALLLSTIFVMLVLVQVAGGLIEDQAFQALRNQREEKAIAVENLMRQGLTDWQPKVNTIMTSNERWGDVGYGESGETYIVASDLLMRNDSRFLIEDPDGYFAAIRAAKVDTLTIDKIKFLNTTINLQPVETEGVLDGLAGNSGETIFEDYRGIEVLSSYRPLDIGGRNWVLLAEIDKAEAFAAEATLQRIALYTMVVAGIFLVVLVWFGSRRLTRPLGVLENETLQVEAYDFSQTGEYNTGRLDKVAKRKDEIGDLAGAFSRMVKVLGFNVRSRTEAEAELNVAADIQQSMLPLIFPSFPDSIEFQMHARLIPAKEIGGDFYEFGLIDDRHFFFTVGDVSGKGVPAALFMAGIKTLIRSGAMQGEPLNDMLTRINDELSRENAEMMFATVWIGVLDLETGEVVFSNAGHNPPLIVTEHGDSWVEEVHGPMVGPIPGIEYELGSLNLEIGDLIVVFSDGVVEAFDPDDELYGEDRLMNLMTGDQGRADHTTEKIIDSVLEWEAGGNRSDDVTVLALRYAGASEKAEFMLVLPYRRLPEGEIIAGAVADDVSKLNAGLEEFAESKDVPDDARMQMSIALDELLTNSASYSGATAVAVRAWANTERFITEISDDGTPFNPLTDTAPADTTSPLEDREMGGLGVHLVKSLMDDVEYAYRGGRNIVTLTKQSKENS